MIATRASWEEDRLRAANGSDIDCVACATTPPSLLTLLVPLRTEWREGEEEAEESRTYPLPPLLPPAAKSGPL
eukprot:749770-Hanusia_phi.AAC.1